MVRERGDDSPNPSFSKREGRTRRTDEEHRERVEVAVTWQEFDDAGRPE